MGQRVSEEGFWAVGYAEMAVIISEIVFGAGHDAFTVDWVPEQGIGAVLGACSGFKVAEKSFRTSLGANLGERVGEVALRALVNADIVQRVFEESVLALGDAHLFQVVLLELAGAVEHAHVVHFVSVVVAVTQVSADRSLILSVFLVSEE